MTTKKPISAAALFRIDRLADEFHFNRGGLQSLNEVTMGKFLLTRGAEYRKGKSRDDLIKAFDRVRRKAYPKTEMEIAMMKLELLKVLKSVTATPVPAPSA